MSFIGYYYYGSHFDELAFADVSFKCGLKLKEGLTQQECEMMLQTESKGKKIQSARWVGQIHIEKQGEYIFSTLKDNNVVMKINGETVISQGKTYKKILDVGLVEAEVDFCSEEADYVIFDFKLYWQVIGGQKKLIPDEVMFKPELNPKLRKAKLMPNTNVILKTQLSEDDDSSKKELADSDNDGICDLWEINGYKLSDDGILSAWKDGDEKKGYVKYISDPFNPHTASDPYTDAEKITGYMDDGVNSVARDPMISAFPAISVGIERIILSRVITQTGEHGQSESREIGSSYSNSTTYGVDINAGWSASQGFSVSATAHYSNTSSQTVDNKETHGTSWSSSISLNKGETADLNANIRYYNTGTATIYGVHPTVNLILGNDTLATITAQVNQATEFLLPGSAYPKRDLNALALNTLDEFSSRLIPLNYDQVEGMDQGQTMKLETTQFSGEYAIKVDIPKHTAMGGKWDIFLPQIEKKTAVITLQTSDNEAIERRAAAKNSTDRYDHTPEITLGSAIKKSFGTQDGKGGRIYFINQRTNEKIAIDENAVHIIMDENTKSQIDKQIKEKKLKNIYDIIIRPGMGIYIMQGIFLPMDNDNDDNKHYTISGITSCDDGINKSKGYLIQSGKGIINYDNFKSVFKNRQSFLLSLFLKTNAEKSSIKLNIGNKIQIVQISNTYERYNFAFNVGDFNVTSGFPISIESLDAKEIYFDDLTIIDCKIGAKYVFNASEDTYVCDGKNADTNFGSAADLRVKTCANKDDCCETFIKFNVSEYLKPINSASICLSYSEPPQVDNRLIIHIAKSVDESWSENKITWNNKPKKGGEIARWSLSHDQKTVEFDVTKYVNEAIAKNKEFSFNISSLVDYKADAVSYYSKESNIKPPIMKIDAGLNGGLTIDDISSSHNNFNVQFTSTQSLACGVKFNSISPNVYNQITSYRIVCYHTQTKNTDLYLIEKGKLENDGSLTIEFKDSYIFKNNTYFTPSNEIVFFELWVITTTGQEIKVSDLADLSKILPSPENHMIKFVNAVDPPYDLTTTNKILFTVPIETYSYIESYEVSCNDQQPITRTKHKYLQDGTVELNLTEYNNGHGVNFTTKVAVKAIDIKGKYHVVYIGKVNQDNISQLPPDVKNHKACNWTYSGNYTNPKLSVNSMYFKLSSMTYDAITSYEVTIDNAQPVARPKYPLEDNSMVKINFTEYNNGIGVRYKSHIKICAICSEYEKSVVYEGPCGE